MITRFKVNGFKNLVNVDLRFGPFTCIAGPNSAGKSNLFDAIRFLSHTTEKTLIDAAKSVRSEGQKNSDIRDIFHKTGNTFSNHISFEAEMIIPDSTVDHLGQKAESAITTVKYTLEIKYNDSEEGELIQIEKEELVPITQSSAKSNLYFSKTNKWTNSIIKGKRPNSASFISTDSDKDGQKIVYIHQDQRMGKTGKRALQLPRTILSTITAEYPTACVTRHEIQSWMMLQLEPSALRKSDEFDKRKNAKIQANGENLPATLYRLNIENSEGDIYQQLSNRLSELVQGIKEINIDKDDKRELLTLMLKLKDGTIFPARSLSDGTLRFIGLAVLELDTTSTGVICLEEPENGIHPQKIDAMIQLLKDISTDTQYAIDENNPLRQIIINTHSPIVVQLIPAESLLVIETKETYDSERKIKYFKTIFSPMANTWRARIKGDNITPVSLNKLLSYLNPVPKINSDENDKDCIRVADRKDVQQLKIDFSI
jgi:predicted ATPase